ncbi:MAG: ester cyclase [Caldilineaceae bacterium]
MVKPANRSAQCAAFPFDPTPAQRTLFLQTRSARTVAACTIIPCRMAWAAATRCGSWASQSAAWVTGRSSGSCDQPLTGEQTRDFWPAWFAGFPEMDFAVTRAIAAPDVVVVQWTFMGTHSGPLEPPIFAQHHEPTGRTVRFRGVSIYDVQDGDSQRAIGAHPVGKGIAVDKVGCPQLVHLGMVALGQRFYIIGD